MRQKRPMFVLAPLLLLAASTAIAATETLHEQRSFAMTAGSSVEVDVSFHDVEVSVGEGKTVDITVDIEISGSAKKARQLIEEYAPVFSEESNHLRVRSARKGSLFNWGGIRTSGKVTVRMPSGGPLNLHVDVSSGEVRIDGDLGHARVEIDSSSGDLTVDGAMQELAADTSSGSVELRFARQVETVEIDTSSGDIKVRGPATLLRASTSSGDIELDGLLGDAELDTSSGDITAGWTTIPPDARIAVSASSGSVRLSLPADTVLRGSIDTGSGGISSDFTGSMSDRGRHFKLYGGPEGTQAVRLQVDTSSGGVKLLKS